MRAAVALLVALAGSPLGGCGAPKPSAPKPAPALPADLASGQPIAATPAMGRLGPMGAAASADFAVATVDGAPIYASCVEAQLAAQPAPAGDEAARRRAALDECVGFELLAREAARRGLGAAQDVAEARRAAAVNRLVELEIDDKIQTPAQLPPAFWARILERNRWRMHRVDYRASAFIRFVVPETAAADSPEDRAARAAADRLAGALAGERGLFRNHLQAKAAEVAQGQRFDDGFIDVMDADRLVPAYSKALFSLPEIGTTSQPVRTQWGWDVILWTKQLPPRDVSEDELARELFPDARLAYFTAWSKAVGKGVKVQVNPDAGRLLNRLVTEEEREPTAAPAGAAPGAAPSAAPTPGPVLAPGAAPAPRVPAPAGPAR